MQSSVFYFKLINSVDAISSIFLLPHSLHSHLATYFSNFIMKCFPQIHLPFFCHYHSLRLFLTIVPSLSLSLFFDLSSFSIPGSLESCITLCLAGHCVVASILCFCLRSACSVFAQHQSKKLKATFVKSIHCCFPCTHP